MEKPFFVDVPISDNVIRALILSGRLKSNRTHDCLAVHHAVQGLLRDIFSGKEPMPSRRRSGPKETA